LSAPAGPRRSLHSVPIEAPLSPLRGPAKRATINTVSGDTHREDHHYPTMPTAIARRVKKESCRCSSSCRLVLCHGGWSPTRKLTNHQWSPSSGMKNVAPPPRRKQCRRAGRPHRSSHVHQTPPPSNVLPPEGPQIYRQRLEGDPPRRRSTVSTGGDAAYTKVAAGADGDAAYAKAAASTLRQGGNGVGSRILTRGGGLNRRF
jgi:hypothetical protein